MCSKWLWKAAKEVLCEDLERVTASVKKANIQWLGEV